MEQSRRAVIRSGVALTAGTLAGCLGGSSGDEKVSSLPTPSIGPDDAEVTIEGFEDFACSHCGRFALEELPRLKDKYIDAGVVRYEHNDFPIPVDEKWSWKAPSAARAVHDTVGEEAFFQFLHGLYQNMDSYSLDVFGTLAEEVGADPEVVRDAATNETYKPVIEDDRSYGTDLGVQGTPTLFVNGTKAQNYSFETVSSLVEAKRP